MSPLQHQQLDAAGFRALYDILGCQFGNFSSINRFDRQIYTHISSKKSRQINKFGTTTLQDQLSEITGVI